MNVYIIPQINTHESNEHKNMYGDDKSATFKTAKVLMYKLNTHTN